MTDPAYQIEGVARFDPDSMPVGVPYEVELDGVTLIGVKRPDGRVDFYHRQEGRWRPWAFIGLMVVLALIWWLKESIIAGAAP